MTAPLRHLAAMLGGSVVAGQVLCPGPGHSPADRSLAVRPAPTMPDGLVVFSHCGDDWHECREHVLGLLGHTPYKPPQQAYRPPKAPHGWAQIWRDAVNPKGTLVERYLNARALDLRDGAAEFIRFHPTCPWSDDAGNHVRVPAMVALFRTITGDEPSAIQRTALRGDGSKIGRKMLGPVAGCAIKAMPDEDVLFRLGVSEGLENALAANQDGHGPCWALGSAAAIRNLPVLPPIETLVLIAEHCSVNEAAREICGTRWFAAGCEVLVVEPRDTGLKDLNDVLMKRASR